VTGAASRALALAGLLGLAAMIAWPLQPASLIGAAPLGALVLAGALAAPRWAIATAIVMLPYFSYGVMVILTDPPGRTRAVLFAVLTIAVFLAALDSMRRR
jgi:uncharacterized membrane protein